MDLPERSIGDTERYGAVSRQTALEMVEGGAAQVRVDLAVAVTGIADRAAAVRTSRSGWCTLAADRRTEQGFIARCAMVTSGAPVSVLPRFAPRWKCWWKRQVSGRLPRAGAYSA